MLFRLAPMVGNGDPGRTQGAASRIWEYAAYANSVLEQMQRMQEQIGGNVGRQGDKAPDVPVETPMVYQVRRCPRCSPLAGRFVARYMSIRFRHHAYLCCSNRVAYDVCFPYAQIHGQG